MPGFDAIIGQRLPVRLLQQFMRKGAIPHALLFTGIPGIGKRTLARTFAMALNCRPNLPENFQDTIDPAPPCGKCPACLKISNERHPDVVTLRPQKTTLRIDQIRDLLSTLAMKPFSAEHRVVIIDEAQALTPEAGNALLKVLEEPPPDTILILICIQKSDLLPTIVSRCRNIQFQPLSPEDLARLLSHHQGLAPEHARVIAGLAGGSYEKARLLAAGKWQDMRQWLIQAFGLAQSASTDTAAITAALALAARLAQSSDRIDDMLEILSTWLRDLAVLPYSDDGVVNADCRPVLRQARSRFSDRQLLNMWEAVQNAQKAIAANGNLRLTMEVMTLGLAGFAAEPRVSI